MTKKYAITHHPIGKPDVEIFSTDTFDHELLTKKFNDFAVNMQVGDILEYWKFDGRYIFPAMLEVEMTEDGLFRWTATGHKMKYNI